ARAEAAVEALQRMASPTATVVRDGTETEVPTEDLVPGDLLVVAEGDAVGADARLVEAAALTVAEASLTGESEPVSKGVQPLGPRVELGDRSNMVFKGTAVTRAGGWRWSRPPGWTPRWAASPASSERQKRRPPRCNERW